MQQKLGQLHVPKRALGQNFLIDQAVIRQIIGAYDYYRGGAKTRLVEIGPGTGALTTHLVNRTDQLIVIEKDAALAMRLSQLPVLRSAKIYAADALDFDFESIVHPSNAVNFVGNLPYNVAKPIIFRLLSLEPSVVDHLIIMVQKEVAERMVASAGGSAYGRLSIFTQILAEATALFDVKPCAFYPRPKVESTVLHLAPKRIRPSRQDMNALSQLTKLCFQQRRKQLGKLLAQLGIGTEVLDKCQVKATQRAQELTIEQFIELARSFRQGMNDPVQC